MGQIDDTELLAIASLLTSGQQHASPPIAPLVVSPEKGCRSSTAIESQQVSDPDEPRVVLSVPARVEAQVPERSSPWVRVRQPMCLPRKPDHPFRAIRPTGPPHAAQLFSTHAAPWDHRTIVHRHTPVDSYKTIDRCNRVRRVEAASHR
jgi:hypothetical protein